MTDRGQGCDRGVASQAFDQPFSTGEATLRKEKAGVGVGLHLARQIVFEHGGILWTDPVPSGGTRVSFSSRPTRGERLTGPPARRGRRHGRPGAYAVGGYPPPGDSVRRFARVRARAGGRQLW